MSEPDQLQKAARTAWEHKEGVWVAYFLGMFLLGVIAKALTAPVPPTRRQFLGQIVLAIMGGVMLYGIGVIQDLDAGQKLVAGALGGAGGVKILEWVVQATQLTRNGNGDK